MDELINGEHLSAYLVVDGHTVHELLPNSTLTIGRLDTNNVVLDDYKVSREHAVLKAAGDRFILIDLASTHGTKVGGEPIIQAELGVGDRFTIVSHELELCSEKPDAQQGIIPNNGSAQQPTLRKLDRRVKFFGGLNEFSLITLVQFLHQEKQHGLLMLEEGQQPGPRIYFRDGEIIHVVEGDRLGELLTRQIHEQSLFFYFHHETEFPDRTIHQSTPNYLMEMCHNQDLQRMKEGNGSVPPGASTIKLPVSKLIAAAQVG
jgi:hypothetical protein